MRKAIYIFCVTIVLLLGPLVIRAQSTSVSGEVLRIQGNTLTIETPDGIREVTVPENILLRRNTMEANISDIQPGDDVTINQSANGELLSVNATAGEVVDWSRWLIPITAGAIAVAGLAWWASKRANKPHIKTATQ
jgi:hypothetical protein